MNKKGFLGLILFLNSHLFSYPVCFERLYRAEDDKTIDIVYNIPIPQLVRGQYFKNHLVQLKDIPPNIPIVFELNTLTLFDQKFENIEGVFEFFKNCTFKSESGNDVPLNIDYQLLAGRSNLTIANIPSLFFLQFEALQLRNAYVYLKLISDNNTLKYSLSSKEIEVLNKQKVENTFFNKEIENVKKIFDTYKIKEKDESAFRKIIQNQLKNAKDKFTDPDFLLQDPELMNLVNFNPLQDFHLTALNILGKVLSMKEKHIIVYAEFINSSHVSSYLNSSFGFKKKLIAGEAKELIAGEATIKDQDVIVNNNEDLSTMVNKIESKIVPNINKSRLPLGDEALKKALSINQFKKLHKPHLSWFGALGESFANQTTAPELINPETKEVKPWEPEVTPEKKEEKPQPSSSWRNTLRNAAKTLGITGLIAVIAYYYKRYIASQNQK